MKVEVINQTAINAIFKKSERMHVKKLLYFLTTMLYYLIYQKSKVFKKMLELVAKQDVGHNHTMKLG